MFWQPMMTDDDDLLATDKPITNFAEIGKEKKENSDLNSLYLNQHWLALLFSPFLMY